jgi:hypothetical protein
VLVKSRTVASEDVSVKALEQGTVECEEWGLQIRSLSLGVVEFRLGDLKCEVVVGEHAPES